MSAAGPPESFEMAPDDGRAALQCEDEALNHDWLLRKRGAALEETIKAIQCRAEPSAAAPPVVRPPETVDAFFSSFLFQMGMTETLECFQAEWAELVQRGLVDAKQAEAVPDVYVEIMRLYRKLRSTHREGEEYGEVSSAAAEILEEAQKARDVQRMHHQRVLVENERLAEELRRLKLKCDSRESEVKRKSEKHQAAVRQAALMSLERDKAVELANEIAEAGSLQHPFLL